MLAVYAFAAWTVFVWTTRARNILQDDGSTLDLVLAAALATLGVAVALTAWRARDRLAPVLAGAVAATLVSWAVRAPMILLDGDHGAAFKAVHTALALASVALALAAWRTTAFWPVARAASRPIAPAGRVS